LLSGCTPPWLPLAAAWQGTDGRPMVVVRTCDDHRASRLRLSTRSEKQNETGRRTGRPTGTASPGPVVTGWRVARGVKVGPTAFPLFAPPPAWHVRRVGPQRFRPGRTYDVHFSHVDEGLNTYHGFLHFTADDLASLRPGQVWAAGRAMSRDDFDDLIDDKC
jgi:hypothetical protein